MTPRRLLAGWSLLAVGCTALMIALPGEETIPYHVAWFGFAVAYGYGPWSPVSTALSVAAYTLASGTVLLWRVAAGQVSVEELAEIPLMCMLVVMMVWHVRHRQSAMDALAAVVERERVRAQMRERLSRITSHEMRTPLTIALGFTDHLLVGESDPGRREDLEVVRDELGRLTRGSERLLRMMHLQDQTDTAVHDLDSLLRQTTNRWSAVTDRTWTVQASAGLLRCSEERLRACLDTLIENAVRYTEPGDGIRVVGMRRGDEVLVGVADSGPGLHPRIAGWINRGEAAPGLGEASVADARSQTGLGLGLVHEVATSRGGRVVAGRSAEGGALLLVVLDAEHEPATEAAGGARAEVGAEPVPLVAARPLAGAGPRFGVRRPVGS